MKKKLLILIYFLSPIILIGILFQANPVKYEDSAVLLGMVLGSIGYTWFIWQFILSSRPKFIETSFGMDKLYQFHGIMAIVTIIAAFIHKLVNENIFGESFMTTLGSIGLFIFIVISIVTLLFMATPAFLKRYNAIKWVKSVVNAVKFVKYEFLRLLHNLTVVAMVFVYLHLLNTTGAKTNNLIFTVYTIYFIIAVLFYLYHKVFKKFISKSKSYTVSNVFQETENIWTIEFINSNNETLKFKPGQFGFFSFKSRKVPKQEHPFSISSSNDQKMTITVKQLGDFTNQLKNLEVGDLVYLDAPYGKFSYLNYPSEKELVFIAGGIGITPMLSMLRHLKQHDTNKNVTLIWGMNKPNDYFANEELVNMTELMPNLKVVPVFATAVNYEGEKGYIDLEKLERIINSSTRAAITTGYYICGPTILLDNTLINLNKIGVKSKQIHFETFSL